MSNSPKVGDGATYSIGSDSYPVTVVEVSKSGHRIVVRDDDAKLVSGSEQTNDAMYEFMPLENGGTRVFTRRKDGAYRLKGGSYGRLTIGERHKRRDPHF